MKTQKKVFCVVLCISLLIALLTPSFAVNDENDDNYSFLSGQGYSDSFLDNYTDDYLKKMVEIIGDNEIGSIETTEAELCDNDAMTLSNDVNSSSMRLHITASEVCKRGSNKIETVLVTISWDWDAYKPIYRGKDAVSANWDNNVFTYANGFYGQDLYKSNAGDNWTLYKEYNTVAQITQGGLGNWTDLKALKKYVGGAILFVLAPASPMYKGSIHTTAINVGYAHSRVPLNGLSINAGDVGVGISWNYSCDWLSSSHFFRYSL